MAEIGKALLRTPKKIKKGSVVKVQSIIIHPNHTGRKVDKETNKVIPANFIEQIKVEFAGKTVYDVTSSAAMSKDPYFACNIKVNAPGELKISWRDSKGKVYEKTAQLNAT